MNLNDQMRQLLALYTESPKGEALISEAEEELVAVLDDNLSDFVKIKLSTLWIDIGCTEDEEDAG